MGDDDFASLRLCERESGRKGEWVILKLRITEREVWRSDLANLATWRLSGLFFTARNERLF